MFGSKGLTATKTHGSIFEREGLGILQGLEKFNHYCLTHRVSVMTNHEALVTIFKKDVANLSHRLQGIPKSRHNNSIKKDEEIPR